MNQHKEKKCLGITLPFTVRRVCQAVFVCVSCVVLHQVVESETLCDLGSPFYSHSVLCFFVVSSTS